MLKILSVDPGEKVGWATAEVDEDHVIPYDLAGHASGDTIPMVPKLTIVNHGISSLKPFAIKLSNHMDDYDVVIYETWRLSARAGKLLIGNDMQTSQLIGMIRMVGWQCLGRTTLYPQAPAVMTTARKTLPPGLQETIDNEPKAHDDAHNVSALLHLWHWYWSTYV